MHTKSYAYLDKLALRLAAAENGSSAPRPVLVARFFSFVVRVVVVPGRVRKFYSFGLAGDLGLASTRVEKHQLLYLDYTGICASR